MKNRIKLFQRGFSLKFPLFAIDHLRNELKLNKKNFPL